METDRGGPGGVANHATRYSYILTTLHILINKTACPSGGSLIFSNVCFFLPFPILLPILSASHVQVTDLEPQVLMEIAITCTYGREPLITVDVA